MNTKILLSVALLALPLMGAGEAQSRSLGKILSDSGLSPDDIEVMEIAARQLFEPLGRTGDARRWSNSKSRSNGAVTLGRIDGNCAELVHRVSTVKRRDPATYRTWRCRTADGEWRVSPGPE
ncbi:MAG TPA: hypothetical protein VJ906_11500 [Roseovarius sp.]|nr:hypothetical protein [Roseovarius sp.]